MLQEPREPKEIMSALSPLAKLEILQRILRLEGELGYVDRAVAGGLDRFLDIWREELEFLGTQNLARKLLELLPKKGGYRGLTPALRMAWVADIETALRDWGEWFTSLDVPIKQQPSRSYKSPGRSHAGVPSRRVEATPKGLSMDSPTTVVSGVGPRIASKLEELGIPSVRSMLYHFPRRYIPIVWIKDLDIREEQGIVGHVWEVRVVRMGERGRKEAAEAVLGDSTGNIRVLWHNQSFVARTVHANDRALITGRLRPYRGQRTLEASGYEILDESEKTIVPGGVVPVYPSTEGLAQRTLRRVIRSSLEVWLPRVEEFLPIQVVQRQGLLHVADALRGYHYPADWVFQKESRRRLAFDELLLAQLTVLSRKRRWQEEGAGLPLRPKPQLIPSFLASLPFVLTEAQDKALSEVLGDMTGSRPMSRLLQGEVGSGKTVVALAAMLVAAAEGSQAALMAPTEILAEQHFLTLSRLLHGMASPTPGVNLVAVRLENYKNPVVVGLLLGSMRKREKEDMMERVARGEVDILVGTHALIQEDIALPRLALAVVDEQQRFGVAQRSALREKGKSVPHLLAMSATPIPRTLALTLYGDLDLSVLDQLPSGRKPVQTRWLRPDQRDAAYRFVRRQVEKGRQAFVICPLIQESEVLQARAALEEYEILSKDIFPDLRVGLLHGRMPLSEKQKVMEEFRIGNVAILVSTPVVEVGVDVPNATVMLIDGADRFGLSELHQFRGRVGRGEHASYCLLLSDDPSNDAQERLAILEREANGFRVAEADLNLRGPGELFGTRQSGLPDLRVAGLSDQELLIQARTEANMLLEADPELDLPEHIGLREALRPYNDDVVQVTDLS